MAPYIYAPLQYEAEEVRIVCLMPGQREDPIEIQIFHAPLSQPSPKDQSKGFSLEQIQRTLPENWIVGNTISGRLLYLQVGFSSTGRNSWKHPDPQFDLSGSNPCEEDSDVLEHGLEYEALSYHWGSPDRLATIFVVGQQSESTIDIRTNLAIALRHLRYADKPRILWVDAICINQNDILERNHEVKRMKSIYTLAKRTIVWLGEESDDSTHALLTVQHFGQQVEFLSTGNIGDSPTADLEHEAWWRPDYLPPYDENTWSSLIALFQRPWFDRVLVLQEALLGNRESVVQCGNVTILWSIVRTAALILERKDTIPQGLRSILSTYVPGLMPTSLRGLPELLKWVKYRSCTDPRDKIYGILGLVPFSLVDGIKLDYSMSVSHIYMGTILAYISATKRLDLLLQCRLSQRLIDGPSWVPNWAFQDQRPSIGSRIALGYRPSGRSSAQAHGCAPNVLEVLGLQCATISSVGAVASGEADAVLETIREWESKYLQQRDSGTDSTLLDDFLQLVFQGRINKGYRETLHYPSPQELRRGYLGATTEDKASMLKIIEKLWLEDGSMVTTQEGCLGMASPGAKEGDTICIPLGCNFPIVLRPTTFENFELVGLCFLHGFMDGEAFLGPVLSPWEVRWTTFNGLSTQFFNTFSSETTFEDPRLPPLSREWELISRDIKGEGLFRHTVTGKEIHSDPRMLPAALKQRGIELRSFRLV